MGERPTIVVAGAGIGGLTSALALAGAGFEVVVCERAEELTELGAGIQLSPNAGRVLADLGLEGAISAVGIEPEAIEVRSAADGRVITSLPGARFRERYGIPYRVIHRADLQTVLVGAVRRHENITLKLGVTVSEILLQGAGIFVRTASEVVPAAGLVGADGVWSTTRAKIPGANSPRPAGRTAWRATLALDNAPTGLAAGRVCLWLGADAHLVHYPVANGAAINIVAIVAENWEKKGWSAPGERAWLLDRFARWPEAARRLIARPFGWQKWALNAVDANGPWTSGPIALLGDAAHAMTPFLAQGAAMAIEDAAVLAKCLAAAPGDVPLAFRAYESERKTRVAQVAAAARRTGDVYHFGSTLGAIRDFGLRVAGPARLLARNDWIYRWRADPG